MLRRLLTRLLLVVAAMSLMAPSAFAARHQPREDAHARAAKRHHHRKHSHRAHRARHAKRRTSGRVARPVKPLQAGQPVRQLSTAKAAAVGPCPDVDLAPAPGNLPAIRAAVLCLHNQIRAAHGLPLLRANTRLRRAAAGHSTDMVLRRYFEHTAPGGVTFVKRILQARYTTRDAFWTLGENIAWGTSTLSTPAGIMRAWMNSPEHRANILRRAYRELGVGVVVGVPSDPAAGATYTADFGARR